MATNSWALDYETDADNEGLETEQDPVDSHESSATAKNQDHNQTSDLPQRKTIRATKSKRKGSPLDKACSIKRVNSDPNISSGIARSVPFNELVLHTFKDPDFIDGIKPAITTMMSPVIDTTIERAVKSAVRSAVEELRSSVVDELITTNKSLQETVKKQMDLIESQKALIDKQTSVFNEKCSQVAGLESQVKVLTSRVDKMSVEMNDIEQYGRRNSIRVSNFTCTSDATESVLTESMVKFLNENVLPDDSKIQASDVERCHPVGRPNVPGRRLVLVKFKTYHTKYAVYKHKRNLKGNMNSTFISEDLTKYNHDLVKSLSLLKRDRKIHSFWTHNGHVYAKKKLEEPPFRIVKQSDIE